MTKINLIMLLLPFVFMIHEYEEIIMFRHWIDRNRENASLKSNRSLRDEDFSTIPLPRSPLALFTSSYLFLAFRFAPYGQ